MAFQWQGDWDGTTNYNRGDCVNGSGSLYICGTANIDADPTQGDGTYWLPLPGDPNVVILGTLVSGETIPPGTGTYLLSVHEGCTMTLPSPVDGTVITFFMIQEGSYDVAIAAPTGVCFNAVPTFTLYEWTKQQDYMVGSNVGFKASGGFWWT